MHIQKILKIVFYGGPHKAKAIGIRIDPSLKIDKETINYDKLSKLVKTRLKKHMCGVEGCECSYKDWKWYQEN